MRDRDRHQSWFDGQHYPELFMYRYDSSVDIKYREKGISCLNREVRDLIKFRLENGVYPDRLHYLALYELKLKHPDE